MWALAERAPASVAEMDGIAGLGPWRLASYGAELLRVLHGQ